MKKKPKRKSNNILDRLFARHYQFYTPLPLDKVMERLHEMSGEFTHSGSIITVESEEIADGYLFNIEVVGNPDISLFSHSIGTAREVNNGGTVVTGSIQIDTNLVIFSLAWIVLMFLLLLMVSHGQYIRFVPIALVIVSLPSLSNLIDLFIKSRLLRCQLENTKDDLSIAESKLKMDTANQLMDSDKTTNRAEFEADEDKTQTQVQ